MLRVEVDVFDSRPEELAPPRTGVCGRHKERVEVASAGFPLHVSEYFRDFSRVQEEPVPEFAFLPLVDSAACEDGSHLVVSAKRLGLPLLPEDERDLGELRRDVTLPVRPVP